MKVLCIDNSNKPNEIRTSNWIKLKQEYNVVKIKRNRLTNEEFFELEEIKPDAPYGGYKVTRFSFDLTELLDLVKSKEIPEEVFA